MPTLARNVTDVPKDRQAPAVYREADPAKAVAAVDPGAFFEPDYTSTLLAMIQAVMDCRGAGA